MSVDSAPRAVEVENLRKYFSVPGATPRGMLNRVMHPVQRGSRRTLRVLEDVSFEVGRGEIFGIVGRNGSGKSTLLRLLASIYRPDAGRISITGSVAPFIELGVGFHPDMSARQNVAMNGVMLGLGRREVKHKIDSVLAYAELEDFADVQLKNFSSGMRMRLAFASMRQADPDVYLIDEILAVGDETFREKCAAEFHDLKQQGKTILMVTHRPGIIETESDRAMLLQDGRIVKVGDPGDVLEAYRVERLAGLGRGEAEPVEERSRRHIRATIKSLTIAGTAGSDRVLVPSGSPIRLSIAAKATGWVQAPMLELAVYDQQGTRILVSRDRDLEQFPVLKPDAVLRAEATLENFLAPGRYRLECVLLHSPAERTSPISEARSIEFEVGGARRDGLVIPEGTFVFSSEAPLERAL